jgi:hypothetical protein
MAVFLRTPTQSRGSSRLGGLRQPTSVAAFASRAFSPWVDRARRQSSREQARASFLAEVKAGKASFDLLHYPLLPYQREGMLHLAFAERASSPTRWAWAKVQAIAACELLAPPQRCAARPGGLSHLAQGEWEEQIALLGA